MDDPKDFSQDISLFVGYYYSPDYVYADSDNYELGIIVQIVPRYFYQPAYKVYWFKKKAITETVQEYLQLVIIKKGD